MKITVTNKAEEKKPKGEEVFWSGFLFFTDNKSNQLFRKNPEWTVYTD